MGISNLESDFNGSAGLEGTLVNYTDNYADKNN